MSEPGEDLQKVTSGVTYNLAHQDLVDLLMKHGGTLSPLHVLAIAANAVGKLVAMQDKRVVTFEQAMAVVNRNFAEGNREAILQLAVPEGHA